MFKMIKAILPDGSSIPVERGSTVEDVAAAIGPRLKKAAVAGKVDGTPVDLKFCLDKDAKVEILTSASEEALEILRHSTAHLMAQAVTRIFPKAKLAIGPPIENGFYYDFDLEKAISHEDLRAIEKQMDAIVLENLPIERIELSRNDAIRMAQESGEIYKLELLQEIEDESVTFYKQGDFEDLCRGPHLPSTGCKRAYKLLKTAGAYWRGDSSRKMLQRIYGTAFFSRKELDEHLEKLEEAEKRDHRKIGKELDLFSFHDEAPASAFFHPKGAFIYWKVVELIRGLYERYGYQEVITPQIMSVDLWHRSGHYDNYKENMFFTNMDEREYAVKPMNCPGDVLIYASRIRSYRDLPIRYADFGRLHRYELSGVTTGLTRVRTFVQDDGHVFCTKDQIDEEVNSLIDMYLSTYALFGFEDCMIYLSTRPEKSIGSDEIWNLSESALESVLDKSGKKYRIDEGAGVFYGPKIDFKVHDAMGREWQLGTIQLDFSMPERFDLHYTDRSGELLRPVMIHRAMVGSLERFLGVYIEHTGGAFPVWIAPVQVRVISVNDSHVEYCEEVAAKLRSGGFRVEPDNRNEKIGYKIREATLEKIPFMIIIGDREIEKSNVSVRERREGELGNMGIDEFSAILDRKVDERS